jgi:omega-hydroxy-beta-dihydromenaquinone-9 sulfotransferase
MWQLWRNSLAYSSLQEPDREMVDELILSWYEELFSLFERDRNRIPQDALYEMKYEDLEEKPVEILRSTYETLGLPGFDRVQDKITAYLESIKTYQKNPHQMDDESREKVSKRWRFTFERYGYNL